MKKILLLAVLALGISIQVQAQKSKTEVVYVTGVPSSCAIGKVYINRTTGNVYTYKTGVGCFLAGSGSAGITNAAGANVVPKSNGTNLVASRITDAGAGGDITIDSDSGEVQIKADSLIEFYIGGVRQAYIYGPGLAASFSYSVVPGAGNSLDLGASGNAWRSGFFGTSIVSPLFNFSTTVTPSATGDTQGSTGDMRYDANFIYIKTAGGWKRAALSTF